MKNTLIALAGVLLTTSALQSEQPSAVTYEFSGGRLGDNLITYLHGKWISHKYDLPLLYKPFPMSTLFALHYEETNMYNRKEEKLYKQILLGRGHEINKETEKESLYIVPYFPESPAERVYFRDGHGDFFPFFAVDWKDKEFRKLALKLLEPIEPVELCSRPKDVVSVAVHVRTGRGYDHNSIYLDQPLKIPPKTFYLEQLSTICEIYGDIPLHFHMFTDDPDPESLAADFAAHLAGKNVTFVYRESENRHDKNVLEDFFSMMQFDALIRPESSFSILASLLKDYEVLIYPADFEIINKVPYINRVVIETSEGSQ